MIIRVEKKIKLDLCYFVLKKLRYCKKSVTFADDIIRRAIGVLPMTGSRHH